MGIMREFRNPKFTCLEVETCQKKIVGVSCDNLLF